MVVVPFWTNSLIRTYAVIIILKSRGVLSNLLEALGLTNGPVSLLYTDTAMFVGFTYTLLPFMILPLFAAIEKLDRNLLDAARDLGAGSLRAFWNVTLPLTMPGILAGSMLVFLPPWACSTSRAARRRQVHAARQLHQNQMLLARDWPLGAAASTVLTVALAVMIVLWRVASRRAREDETEDLLAEARHDPQAAHRLDGPGLRLPVLPILVVIVYSFNDATYSTAWRGFTWKWYGRWRTTARSWTPPCAPWPCRGLGNGGHRPGHLAALAVNATASPGARCCWAASWCSPSRRTSSWASRCSSFSWFWARAWASARCSCRTSPCAWPS
jgi:ABC-type spermidine/putrescine transport system permease subunit II